jgi:hypothetical protein
MLSALAHPVRNLTAAVFMENCFENSEVEQVRVVYPDPRRCNVRNGQTASASGLYLAPHFHHWG